MSLKWLDLVDMKSSHDWSVLAECELKSIRATRRLLYKEQILLTKQLSRIEAAKREALRHRNHQEAQMRKELEKKQKKIQSYICQEYTSDQINRRLERRHALISSPTEIIHDYAANFDSNSSYDAVKSSQGRLLTRPLPSTDNRRPRESYEEAEAAEERGNNESREDQKKQTTGVRKKPGYSTLFPTLPRIIEQIKPEPLVSEVEIVKPAVMHKSKDQYRQQLPSPRTPKQVTPRKQAKTEFQMALVVSLPRHNEDVTVGGSCTLPNIDNTQVFYRPLVNQESNELK